MQSAEFLIQLQTELAISKERYTGIKQQIDILCRKCEEVEKQFTQLTAKYEIHNNLIVFISDRYKEIQKSLTDINNLYAKLHEQVVVFETKLKDVTKDDRYLMNQDKEIKQQIKDIIRDYSNLHIQMEELGNQITEINAKVEPLHTGNLTKGTVLKWTGVAIGGIATLVGIIVGCIEIANRMAI